MIEITHVTQEKNESGAPIVRHDPRPGLSDYTVYTLWVHSPMTQLEMMNVPEMVKELLRSADYSGEPVFELVAKRPVACFASTRVHIGLVLFSHFPEEMVMDALDSGMKNLNKQDGHEYDPYCHC